MVGGKTLVVTGARRQQMIQADGRAARRGARLGLVLLRAASRRTALDGFSIIWLSRDYCLTDSADCLMWIKLWQRQTTKVLRRRYAELWLAGAATASASKVAAFPAACHDRLHPRVTVAPRVTQTMDEPRSRKLVLDRAKTFFCC